MNLDPSVSSLVETMKNLSIQDSFPVATHFPNEITMNILVVLEDKDLDKVQTVSKSFLKLIEDNKDDLYSQAWVKKHTTYKNIIKLFGKIKNYYKLPINQEIIIYIGGGGPQGGVVYDSGKRRVPGLYCRVSNDKILEGVVVYKSTAPYPKGESPKSKLISLSDTDAVNKFTNSVCTIL